MVSENYQSSKNCLSGRSKRSRFVCVCKRQLTRRVVLVPPAFCAVFHSKPQLHKQELGKLQTPPHTAGSSADNIVCYFSVIHCCKMFLTHSCPIRALLPLTRDSHLILHEDKKHLDISLFFLLFCWCCILSATLGSPAGLAIQYCLFPHLTFPESTETWGLPKLHIQAFGLALLITTAHYLPFVLFKKFSWTGYFLSASSL